MFLSVPGSRVTLWNGRWPPGSYQEVVAPESEASVGVDGQRYGIVQYNRTVMIVSLATTITYVNRFSGF